MSCSSYLEDVCYWSCAAIQQVFYGYGFQDWFKRTRIILVHFPSRFFFMYFFKVQAVQLYSCTTRLQLGKSPVLWYQRDQIFLIINLSIAFYALCMLMLISLSVDWILLPTYVNWFHDIRHLSFNEDIVIWRIILVISVFIWVHVETDASSWLFQDM